MNDKALTPALYLLPTGLSDADPREVIPAFNIDVMRGIRHFVVENVRTARRWIRRCDPEFGFEGIEFYELNVNTPPEDVWRMLGPLRGGLPMGVMSEAGCPAVADPGADIVALAQREGLKVVPLVGPSSILMSLMGSGFNGQSFCFHGYLPIDDAARRQALRRLEGESARENRTQIFIETPYRNRRLLDMMLESLQADTRVCVACDITAADASIRTMSVAQWKSAATDIGKKPAIFLLYRGSRTGSNSHDVKDKRRGRR